MTVPKPEDFLDSGVRAGWPTPYVLSLAFEQITEALALDPTNPELLARREILRSYGYEFEEFGTQHRIENVSLLGQHEARNTNTLGQTMIVNEQAWGASTITNE